MPESLENQFSPNITSETKQDEDPYLDELKVHMENGNIPKDTILHKAAANMLLEAGIDFKTSDIPNQQNYKYEGTLETNSEQIVSLLECNDDEIITFGNKEARILIDSDKIKFLADHLEKFQRLDSDIANELVQVGQGSRFVDYLDKFNELNYSDLANRLIEAGEGYCVANNLDKFQGLNHVDVANRLIEAGQARRIVKNLEKFDGLDTDIANRLIEAGEGWSVAENLDKFNGLDHVDIANRLIEAGEGYCVASNLDKFNGLNYSDLANRLIETGEGGSVASNLKEFQGLNYSDIANRLIDAGKIGAVADNLNKFHELGTDVVNRLIEAGKIKAVVDNLDKFQGLDKVNIAYRLIEAGEDRYVVKNLEKFDGLDHVDIANRLIEARQGYCVANNLEKFDGLNHIDLANRLIEAGQGYCVTDFLEDFIGLNHVDIANKLFETGQGHSVGENIDRFHGLDNVDIANKLIEADGIKYVAEYLCRFYGLSADIANSLIEAGYGEGVAEYLDNFQSLPGEKALLLSTLLSTEYYCSEQIKSNLFRFTDIPEDDLVKLRELFNTPELTNMPRGRINENGEIIQPSSIALDRWYGDLSYVYMEGGFNKATIGHLIRLRIEHGIDDDIHDASQWLSTFKIPETSYDVNALLRQRESDNFNKDSIDEYSTVLIDTNSEKQFFLQLLNADQGLRQKLNYEGIKQAPSDEDKLQDIFNLKPELKNEFNTQLGLMTGQLTESFYNELLNNNSDLKQGYDETISSGMARRKYFKDLLKQSSGLLNEFNQQREQMLLSLKTEFYNSALSNNPELDDEIFKTNKSNNPINNEEWFFAPENQLLFRAAMDDIDGAPLYKHDNFNLDTLFEQAEQIADNFIQTTAFGVGKEETVHNLTSEQLRERLSKIHASMQLEQAKPGRIGETVQLLARAKLARTNYITDTQNWLKRHAVSPQSSLTKAWGDRAIALAQGEKDNAKAINGWQSENAVRLLVNNLEANGELQSNYDLTRKEVLSEEIKPSLRELSRRLSAKNTIEALSKLKKWEARRETKGIESILPAASISVEIKSDNKLSNYNFEILDKKDPRGFTIGEDTYCCMTIDGVSKGCIKAGYVRENCGFVATYNNKETLVAQSFWYINPEKPDIVVMDNIEANGGQDLQKIAEVYRQALTSYLKSHPELKITKVHVGTGYTDIDLANMPKVEPSKPLKYVNYTDADNQRLLLDLNNLAISR